MVLDEVHVCREKPKYIKYKKNCFNWKLELQNILKTHHFYNPIIDLDNQL